MRPGPGLVVMALAFISGARRGSTSTSSKSSSSTTTSSTTTLPSAFITSTASETDKEPPTPLFFPAYLGGGGVLTSNTKSLSSYSQQGIEEENYRVNYYNYIYNSYSNLPPFVPPRHKTIQEDQHLRLETLSGLKSSSRATRQTRIISSLTTDGRNEFRAKSGAVIKNTNINVGKNIKKQGSNDGSDIGSGYEIDDGAISVEDQTSEGSISAGTSVSGDSEGLPVQFPSNSADSSKSFDEDDILALVAEDDLLSEESFDRLTKLTDDKVGYVVVDDYDATNEDSTNGVNESPLVSSNENHHQRQQSPDKNNVVNGENSGHEDDSGKSNEFQNEQEHSIDTNKANVEDKSKQSMKGKVIAENKESNQANLGAVADFSYVAAFSENGLSHTVSSVNTDNRIRDTKWSIFESDSPLTRLNPWISACDLAQPGTAPDLQGQCSAGTLPVALVDEGPGPPTCPISCEKLKTSIANNINKKYNNKNKMLNKNNEVNFKAPTSNLYDIETMLRVRRDLSQWAGNDSNKFSVSKQNIELSGTKINENSMKFIVNTISGTSAQSHQANGNHLDNNKLININQTKVGQSRTYEYPYFLNVGSKYLRNAERRLYNNKQKKQDNGSKDQFQTLHQQTHQNQQQEKKQQCLDYLGDTEETSPAHLCTFKSPSELASKLRSLRLRHCCERNVFSALHTVALNATLSGGVECVRILMDIMDLDLLATRITCELAEILFRFDCRQVYSLIHQCDDCKEAYRRWVCSTLVPYFAEESDNSYSRSNNNNTNNNHNGSKFVNTTKNRSKKDSDRNVMDVSINNDKLHGDTVQSVEPATQRTKRQLNRSVIFSNSTQSESETGDYNLKLLLTKRTKRTTNSKCDQQQKELKQELQQQKGWQQEHSKQSNIFISTAINADPCTEDPVISKIIKRSKRKVQFRKRKRIRPCLSVCQTVEQKCPYLLPADRAPALPTQYAGEPTFLCLDQSIPETGEQLRKSSYGSAECCYRYCEDIADGVCAYCSEFIEDTLDKTITSRNSTRRLHNITLTATSQYRLDARLKASLGNVSTNDLAASISIALSNSSATAISGQIERLTSYALYDGIYYYDENVDDMPDIALSDDCPPVPSVTSRCWIPHYASSAVAIHNTQKNTIPKDVIGHHMLLLLSAMLCLLTTQTAAMQIKNQIHPNQKQLRKYLRHRKNPVNINTTELISGMKHKKSTVMYIINISMDAVIHRIQYRQEIARKVDIVNDIEFWKITKSKLLLKTPSMFAICVYFHGGIYEKHYSNHYIQNHDRRVYGGLDKMLIRSTNRHKRRNKDKLRKGNRKWNISRNRHRTRNRSRYRDRSRNRNRLFNINAITNKHGPKENHTISQIYSITKRSKEKQISRTGYSDSIRNKYVQLNIGNNNKITYRLNSKLYFNSNTKIYCRNKSRTFRNFNIANNTDYNKHHDKNRKLTITLNKNESNYNYINKYIYNNNYKNNNSIGRIKATFMEKNCQFIYYYNFNINDWWRRWWWCIWQRAGIAERRLSDIL